MASLLKKGSAYVRVEPRFSERGRRQVVADVREMKRQLSGTECQVTMSFLMREPVAQYVSFYRCVPPPLRRAGARIHFFYIFIFRRDVTLIH